MEKNIAAFVREDAKTICVRFFKEIDWSRRNQGMTAQGVLEQLNDPAFFAPEFSNKEYIYVTDLDIQVDDWVVVMAMGQLKVAKVTQIHESVAIEPNSDTKFKWVVSKIDTAHYEENENKNQQIEETIHSAYKQTVKKQFQNMIMSGLDSQSKRKLKSLLGVK